MTSVALHLVDQHVALDAPAEVGQRHALLFQGRLELRFVRQVIGLLDVFEDVPELRIAQRAAVFTPALNEEELINGFEDEVRA